MRLGKRISCPPAACSVKFCSVASHPLLRSSLFRWVRTLSRASLPAIRLPYPKIAWADAKERSLSKSFQIDGRRGGRGGVGAGVGWFVDVSPEPWLTGLQEIASVRAKASSSQDRKRRRITALRDAMNAGLMRRYAQERENPL